MTTASPLTSIGRAALVASLALGLSACQGGLFGGGGEKDVTPTVGNRVPILSRIEGAKVDPALAGVPVVVPAATVNAEWAQSGATPGKSYGHLALPANLGNAWTQKIAGATPRRRLAASPVVGGGMLFVSDSEGVIHAFDAATGARRWSRAAEVAGSLQPANFGGGVSYDQGRVYATNGAGEVMALDASNGAPIWKVKPAGPLRGAPTIAFGAVYVMTQDNQIVALNASDGKLQWNESASSSQTGVFGVATPAAAQGTVIAGYSSGELVAYRYENGRSLWADALARTSISTEVGALTDIDADPIIDSGRVYALGQGGRMAAYELVTGQRIWELNLAGISTPAVAGEWIFTLTDDARLLAIARGSGRIRWITDLGRWRNAEKKQDPIFWTGPVLAGDNLWVGNSEGQIYRVSLGEGAASLFQTLKSPISLPPIVANNMLYVLADDGTIHAYR
ncbi:PQQ-binding-like beta-propeller repeat protein [Altererythrobacter aerius]|uniref:PQQ-binding-like beta-propeller repeat protein n=1 Tax=Tsuneonella aeria TaxID=1837929 RepID=A0A6I4TFK9_9SPHN|nr:PQQ-binding-like beta-propeller repeat protein [Tsuneonella aeria]MXO76082.1 PQQ-binding-like beta-propeller repeat protein [Tsuneonella aeria]